MKVQIGADTYIVSWKHEQDRDALRYRTVPDVHRNAFCDDCPMQNKLYPCYPPRSCRKVTPTKSIYSRGTTTCTVKSDDKVILTGTADCSVNEPNFVKAKGRKVSLAVALRTVTDMEFRKAVWAAYLKQWPPRG